MVERCCINATESFEPLSNVTRIRKDRFRLRYEVPVGLLNRIANLGAIRIVDHVTQRVVPQLVGGAVLVQDPENLVWM